MVIRHPRDGAARLAAEYSTIPVINGGDGSHEHPTQTLCDLFTLRSEEQGLKNLKVAISGDLKGSRTIHSFVYALARFGATIDADAGQGHGAAGACRPAAARGIPLPHGVRCQGRQATALDRRALCHRRKSRTSCRCYAGPEIELETDMVLSRRSTRSMSPASRRSAGPRRSSPIRRSTAKFLNEPKYSEASVMHPLPRVDELDASFDTDRRAIYFEQAAYGVPVRMALISLLLGLKGKSLQRNSRAASTRQASPIYEQPSSVGIQCANPNCIVHDPMEAQYVRNKFSCIAVSKAGAKLRCLYCETRHRTLRGRQQEEQWFTP